MAYKIQEENLIAVKDVAAMLDLKVHTVYKMVHEERIPCYHLSRKCLRFSREEVILWITQKRERER